MDRLFHFQVNYIYLPRKRLTQYVPIVPITTLHYIFIHFYPLDKLSNGLPEGGTTGPMTNMYKIRSASHSYIICFMVHSLFYIMCLLLITFTIYVNENVQGNRKSLIHI